MENKMNEAREAFKKAGEKLQPIMEDIREKAEPVAERIRDGAGDAVDKLKQAVKDAGDKLQGVIPGAETRNAFFDSLEEEAAAMKETAKQTADAMQKKLEALMRGETKQ